MLVYEGAPLERDVTLAGPLEVELWVSTTGTDADWIVKVIDELLGEMPGPKKNAKPGEPAKVKFTLRGLTLARKRAVAK